MKKLLLVDDDRMFRDILTKAAEGESVEISWKTSLKAKGIGEAVEGIDGILLDYDLDDMTGYEVLDALKSSHSEIPVIMVSATNRPWQTKNDQYSNLKGFVSKWQEPEQLYSEIKTIFAG